jgi:glycosyltransferase involved in cell wall biosynthesis
MTAASILLRRPVLSICVTTYNRAPWLMRSLPLILEQASAYRGLVEVIVCDNASPDNTPEVVAEIRKSHEFTYHRNAKNVGMLGNLGASSDLARGEYVWVIGDDDLVVTGTVDRVLGAIATHPDTELIYTNYAFTRFNQPEDIDDVGPVIRGAKAISPKVQDAYATCVSDIATNSENCFTAIYCLIYRSDHARVAYHQDTSGPPFSSLSTSVPTAEYVCRNLLDRPGYWIGDPCVVVNMNVSWLRYATLFILERFPELFDLMQEKGVDSARMDALRSKHVANIPAWFAKIYLASQKENLPYYSTARLVSRFGHLPEFRRLWPKLMKIYEKAFAEGRVDDPKLTPARLEECLRNRNTVT